MEPILGQDTQTSLILAPFAATFTADHLSWNPEGMQTLQNHCFVPLLTRGTATSDICFRTSPASKKWRTPFPDGSIWVLVLYHKKFSSLLADASVEEATAKFNQDLRRTTIPNEK